MPKKTDKKEAEGQKAEVKKGAKDKEPKKGGKKASKK